MLLYVNTCLSCSFLGAFDLTKATTFNCYH